MKHWGVHTIEHKHVFAATIHRIHIFKMTAVPQCTAWSSVVSSDPSSHNVRRVSDYDVHMQKAKHLLIMAISDAKFSSVVINTTCNRSHQPTMWAADMSCEFFLNFLTRPRECPTNAQTIHTSLSLQLRPPFFWLG
jgi:hypothetical protein